MTQISRRRLALASAAAIAAIGAFSAGPLFAQDKSEIVVGAAVPITGAFAAAGIQYYNSLRLAQDDINAAGGINGRKLRIAFEDTTANNSAAVNAFVKLAKQDNPPFIFLSSLSTQDLASEPEVLKAKIPTMFAGGAVAIQERKNPYMFRIRPADNLASVAMASGIIETLKKKKPGILFAQDDYGTGASSSLEAVLVKEGITLAGKESFNPRDNDFSAQLLSLKNKGADVIVTFNYNRDGALILKQRKSLGIDLPVVSGTGMASPATLALVDEDDLKGVYVIADTILGEPISPASADFVRRYVVAYKMRPDTYGAAYYDGAMMLAQALRAVGPDPEKLRGYISNIKDFKGIARSYTNDPALNNMAHSVVLASFKPGTKETVGVATFPKSAKP